MDTSEFPSNSDASRNVRPEKDITPVTTTGAVRKKRSFRKQFTETFVAGDARGAVVFAMFDILLPLARDAVVETLQQGIERLFNGDSIRRQRGATPPYTGATGNVRYNMMSAPGPSRFSSGPQRAISRQARARHNFDEIVLDQRAEANEVIERLFDLVNRYDNATVADLYELVGLSATHADEKWGWYDLQGAGVSRVRGGYLLDLPEPAPLS